MKGSMCNRHTEGRREKQREGEREEQERRREKEWYLGLNIKVFLLRIIVNIHDEDYV